VSLSRRSGNKWWSRALLARTCLLKNLAISISRLSFSKSIDNIAQSPGRFVITGTAYHAASQVVKKQTFTELIILHGMSETPVGNYKKC